MSSITSPPPSLRQRRKDARPLELLEAALALFVEKGFAATRSEEVAQRAGVSKGTLYLYYPSKEELLKAVIAHYLSARIEATAQEVQRYRGPMAPLMRDTLVAWWQQVYDSPGSGCFKIVISEVRNFPDIADFYLQRVVEPGSALIAGIVQRGVASGEFRLVNVASVVHSIVLPMVMLCTHKHALGACATSHAIDAPAFIAEHVDLMLYGLLKGPAQAAPRIPAEPPRRTPR
jgi:AcrR family transcriptional regulator